MSSFSIAVDLMGGDNAPSSVASGMVAAAIRYPDVIFHAVGLPHVIAQYLAKRPPNVRVVPVESKVDMALDIAAATKLGKNSSMGYAIEMVRLGEASVCISAGNTAALMSLAYLMLKTKPGVRRPSIISSIRYKGHTTFMSDLGANVATKAEDLLAAAKLAAQMSEVDNPKVALLNVGTEATKGPKLVKDAAILLEDSDLNYIGFSEGYDILSNRQDVLVFDGFVGNCITKLLETVVANMKEQYPEALLPQFNYAVSLAGLNGSVYKVHGNSDSAKFEQALDAVLTQHHLMIAA